MSTVPSQTNQGVRRLSPVLELVLQDENRFSDFPGGLLIVGCHKLALGRPHVRMLLICYNNVSA